MASPGQRCGLCGHKMAGFDMHDKCARCRDKGLGSDACIVGSAICKICDAFTDSQLLSIPSTKYARIRR